MWHSSSATCWSPDRKSSDTIRKAQSLARKLASTSFVVHFCRMAPPAKTKNQVACQGFRTRVNVHALRTARLHFKHPAISEAIRRSFHCDLRFLFKRNPRRTHRGACSYNDFTIGNETKYSAKHSSPPPEVQPAQAEPTHKSLVLPYAGCFMNLRPEFSCEN